MTTAANANIVARNCGDGVCGSLENECTCPEDCGHLAPGQSCPTEICDNNVDDDKDGLIDCEDPDCDSFPDAIERRSAVPLPISTSPRQGTHLTKGAKFIAPFFP